ncbi:hypothetical protein NECAME_09385 [Necator americanus]|uniref:Uncharacterized protein n=1 Tax=Necator americanus TaxID=51031 RepID=W2TE37_NECAM|nr:hypothetical protein NECAME_09385 [Necator americanus]ETN80113.1 hypothetical protein NECAME_09385 [Necator americanus]
MVRGDLRAAAKMTRKRTEKVDWSTKTHGRVRSGCTVNERVWACGMGRGRLRKGAERCGKWWNKVAIK